MRTDIIGDPMAAVLVGEQTLRRACEVAFQEADEEKRGFLTAEDFKVSVLALLGYKPSSREVEEVWKSAAGEKGLELHAFVGLMLPRLLKRDENDLIRQVFLAMDTHCCGYLTLSDCLGVFGQVLPHLGASEVERLFREVDGNGDGRVSYRDFELMMKHFQLHPR